MRRNILKSVWYMGAVDKMRAMEPRFKLLYIRRPRGPGGCLGAGVWCMASLGGFQLNRGNPRLCDIVLAGKIFIA